jgi:membrane-associated phospholipid phosphatase
VAFALMIAIPAIFLVRRLVIKVLWALYPFVITFVVVVTANHYWVDAVLGALVAAVSAWAATAAFARARPDAWAWQGAAAKA